MAIRIYALAKELKVDSKELVDICASAGITGKGSALASLSDEEAEKLRSHMSGSAGGPASGTRAPGASPSGTRSPKANSGPVAPERPSKPAAREGKMPVISSPRSTGPLAGIRKPKAVSPEAVELAESAEPTPAVPSEPPAKEDQDKPEAKGPRSPGPLARVMKREDYIGPGNASGKLRNIGGSTATNEGTNGGTKPSTAGGQRGRPGIKFAPIPASGQPAPKASSKTDEPTQKPDMKLPADALRAGKSGVKPLSAHLRRHEESLESAKKKEATEKETKGKRGASKTPMLGGREQRQLGRQRQPQRRGAMGGRPHRFRRIRRSGVNSAAPRKNKVSLQLPCTVRELSEAAGVQANQILRILMEEGVMTTIAAQMDPELTELVAAELDFDIVLKEAVSFEDQMLVGILEQEDAEEDLVLRPPVITFLGHVDHGKTSLLDRIINTDVVSGESGGITQHIRAYAIDREGQQISFVDTPGHEAFTEMRARGANVTDIAVLVVAADDGIMPQTEEAISHARAAEVPIVVALNKTDLPGVDINRAMQGLAANELLPSEWGGEVEVIKTSAITGDGIDDLLETLLTVAELHEYKANPNRSAIGTCLEAQQETGRGVVAKVIVQNGTLRVGDVVVCGQAYGRVKALYETLHVDRRLEEAGPSTPVNLTGLNIAPAAGDHFYVLDDIADARTIAESRSDTERESTLGGVGIQHVTLENLFERLEGADEVQTLNLILRADVRGSIEAIQKELLKLEHPEVKIKLLQATVGGITEADVTLADASDAIILGFNVVADENARMLADARGVQIKRYQIIYKITEDLKAALEGLLTPEQREIDLGRALVQQTFKISRVGTIAGCRVLAGTIERNSRARVIRDNTILGDYPIDTLRREKDDSKEVREGMECGIKLSGFNDVKEGDIFEVYRIDEVGRTFDETVNQ